MAYMAVLCFVFMIAATRTNLIFFLLFLLLIPTFACLAFSFWRTADGNAASAVNYMHWAGGLAFVVSIVGWYLFMAQILVSVDFPLSLPVLDLSKVVKGAGDIRKRKEELRENGADSERGDSRFWKRS